MFDTDLIRLGSTPFASRSPVGANTPGGIERFASNEGVVPVAKPPRLWAPLQQPQQNTGDVKMLNKTAPITAPTRPYMLDSTRYNGDSGASSGGGFATLFGADNGG